MEQGPLQAKSEDLFYELKLLKFHHVQIFSMDLYLYSGLLFILLMLVFGLLLLIPLLISDRGEKSLLYLSDFGPGNLGRTFWNSDLRSKAKSISIASTSYIYIFNHPHLLDAPWFPLCVPQEVRAIGEKRNFQNQSFGQSFGACSLGRDRDEYEVKRISVERYCFIWKNRPISIGSCFQRNTKRHMKRYSPFNEAPFRLSIESKNSICQWSIGAFTNHERGSLLAWKSQRNIFSPAMEPSSGIENAIHRIYR